MTDDEERYWEVFIYEANMLLSMYDWLIAMNVTRKELQAAQQAIAIEDEWLYRAVLESELLHIRALVEFFLLKPNPKYPLDLRVAHLVSDYTHPQLEALRREYGDNGKEFSPCDEINKRLAHITKRRVDVYLWTKTIHTLVPILAELIEDVWAHRPQAETP